MKEYGPLSLADVANSQVKEHVPMKTQLPRLKRLVADSVWEASDFLNLMTMVEVCASLVISPKNDRRQAGGQLLSYMETCLQGQEVMTKYFMDLSVPPEKAVNAITRSAALFAELPDIAEGTLFRLAPRAFYLSRTIEGIFHSAIREQEKTGKIANAICALPVFPTREANEACNTHPFTQLTASMQKLDDNLDPQFRRPVQKKNYTRLITSFFDDEASSAGGRIHPLEVVWGGISLGDIEAMPAGKERTRAILRYKAAIPMGDLFWTALTTNIFMLPSNEHDPDDGFEEAAHDFQVFFGNAVLHDMPSDEKEQAQIRKIMNDVRLIDIYKIGSAIGRHLLEANVQGEAGTITLPNKHANDTISPSLTPYMQNIWHYVSQIDVFSKHMAQFNIGQINEIGKMLLDSIRFQLTPPLEFRGNLSGAKNVDQYINENISIEEDEDLTDPIGAKCRALALHKQFSTIKETEALHVLPSTNLLAQLGYGTLSFRKDQQADQLQVRLNRSFGSPTTMTLSLDAQISDCTTIFPQHSYRLKDLVDLVIVFTALDASENKGVTYPEIVVIKEHGVSIPSPLVIPDREGMLAQIRAFEGEDPIVALRRRGYTDLLGALSLQAEQQPSSFGQTVLFDRMRQARGEM